MKKQPRRVAVIRNEHSQAQMSQLDNEYAADEAPSLTLQQALELAKASQQKKPAKPSHEL